MADAKSTLELVATTVQVLAVVAGVVISVLSFNSTRLREAAAREAEAMKPLAELRRTIYLETVKTAALLATPGDHAAAETDRAKRRFRELYVAELSMVEAPGVEKSMIAFAKTVDPTLLTLTPSQAAAYDLAHALRESYVERTSGTLR